VRWRLVTSYVLLLCLVLLAVEVPLAWVLASRETQRVAADRLADATRFASLAAPALRTGELQSLIDELRRYDDLYGIGTLLVDQDQQVISEFGAAGRDRSAAGVAIRSALAGHLTGTPGVLWPWQRAPLVVAVPVNDGGVVLGAVVTISPAGRERRSVAESWLQLVAIWLAAVAVCVLTALRLAGWVLRPVIRLDKAVHEIAGGDDGARVQPGVGPPELRRLAGSFNEMADAVAQVLERQRSFVAHASHQLRNPLTVLRLRVEDLGTRLTDDDARADHRIALEETDRLAEVLDGLLALARAEVGQHRTEVVDAVAVALNRQRAWSPLTERLGVELSAVVPSEPRWARLVATALDQSLDALIDNALKFTPPGGRVVVSVASDADGVEVSVCDSGPGMSEEQCRLATERFWRAPEAQNVDGAGLGLPIVRVLVEASGGRLALGSAATGGLAARIWFPAAPAGAAGRGAGPGHGLTDR
jgi:signal transduction histidine kinase